LKALKVTWVARTFLGSLDSSLGRRLERLCEHPEQRPPELGVCQRLVQPVGVGDFILLGPGATRRDQRTQQYLQQTHHNLSLVFWQRHTFSIYLFGSGKWRISGGP